MVDALQPAADAVQRGARGGRVLRGRPRPGRRRGGGGCPGHHPARRAQGPRQLPRRAQRRTPGPGCHIERSPRAVRRTDVGRIATDRRDDVAKYVGAIDQGTTSTRFMIFDHGGKVAGDRPEGAHGTSTPLGDQAETVAIKIDFQGTRPQREHLEHQEPVGAPARRQRGRGSDSGDSGLRDGAHSADDQPGKPRSGVRFGLHAEPGPGTEDQRGHVEQFRFRRAQCLGDLCQLRNGST